MNSLYRALYAHGPGTDRPMPGGRLLFAGRADALAEAVIADYEEQQRFEAEAPEMMVEPPTTLSDNPFDMPPSPVPDEAFEPLIKELRPDHEDIGRLGLTFAEASDPEAMQRLNYLER